MQKQLPEPWHKQNCPALDGETCDCQPKALRLVVITKIAATGEIEGRKVIDHADHFDRKWLGKHCFWAFRNGRSILTVAESDCAL